MGRPKRRKITESDVFLRLDGILIPLALNELQAILDGSHACFEGLDNATALRVKVEAVKIVMQKVPERIVSQDGKQMGVIVFPTALYQRNENLLAEPQVIEKNALIP